MWLENVVCSNVVIIIRSKIIEQICYSRKGCYMYCIIMSHYYYNSSHSDKPYIWKNNEFVMHGIK